MTEGGMDLESALREVLLNSLAVDGLCRGLHECAKALDQHKKPVACILAEDCDEKAYGTLVEALCKEHSITLIKFPSNKLLGELAGLCKIDKEGKARKVVRASCVVIKEVGESSPGWHYLCEHHNVLPKDAASA